jgi:hypothetical protein
VHAAHAHPHAHTQIQRTHDSQVFHVGRSVHLPDELVIGELAVDHLLVAGADKSSLLVQKRFARTGETERIKQL